MEVLYIHDPPSCQPHQRDASSWFRNTNLMGSYSQGPFFVLKQMFCEQNRSGSSCYWN